IKMAKRNGVQVTCEVSPHHLFLFDSSGSSGSSGSTGCCGSSGGKLEVRPSLATIDDQQALWDNLEWIDCFATDHAPHLLSEKNSDKPPPGFPGLETALPLLLTAVNQGRLKIQDIVEKYSTNPRKILGLPVDDINNTFIEIDMDYKWTIPTETMYCKSKWTP